MKSYKRELKKMHHHRREYYPVLKMLNDLYNGHSNKESSLEITDPKDMAIVLELLDIEYLDIDAFFIRNMFGDITNVIYNGNYPLTSNGETYLNQYHATKGRIIIKVISILLTLILTVILYKIYLQQIIFN